MFAIVLTIVPFTQALHAEAELLKREYSGFTLWLDCEERHGAVAFFYEIGADRGNFRQKGGKFIFDRKVPLSCQPQSWRSYKTTTVRQSGSTWERGFLVPSNHMDNNKAAMKETFYLTNTLPQDTTFDQSEGAWRQTEMITECYREITALKVWGGVIWGNNGDNDFFIVTHGIETPDYWWKLIYRPDKKEYIAWVFPNNPSALASKIDNFTVSIQSLKKVVDFIPDNAHIENLSQVKASASWPVEKLEDRLRCEGKSTSSG